jgi:serine/threonine-protein kinase
MGCAFLCRDRLRKKVVVKVFWEARKGSIDEVFSEVFTMSQIAGKYVPIPIDYDYVDKQKQDRPFIVMEYVEGSMDGEAYLKNHGKMELLQGLEVGLQVAKGLEVAHAAGICHLDLKPANLLLRQVNGQWEVKIIDFGLSRVATSLKHEAIAKSRSGKSMFMQEVFGTLDYAPPEQLGDGRYGRPGPHSDIFSYGATLYRLLSGESPRTINPLCMPNNPQLFQILAQCLMAETSRRPSSAGELVKRLDGVLSEARLTPSDRYRQYLRGQLTHGSILEQDEELEFTLMGRDFGLNIPEIKRVLSKVMGELSVRNRREVEEHRLQSAKRRTIIDLYRPIWLSDQVVRNESHDAIPGPHNGGCLVQLLDLPSGLRRKVILARDGSPILEMVEIPAGKFLMGSSGRDSMARDDEKPQREVYLNTYWIARTPVTNRMWQKFLQESGYNWNIEQPSFGKLDHPAVYVNYMDAWAFCDYYGLMLPSEAQWEKAARGGDGRIWPWGDQKPTTELCNFEWNVDDTTPVGHYLRGISPFGLVDCAGNVWEWCADEYNHNLLQELDPNSGRVIRLCKNRVNFGLALRGGSFYNDSEIVRCAYRSDGIDDRCRNCIGFRPALDEAF